MISLGARAWSPGTVVTGVARSYLRDEMLVASPLPSASGDAAYDS